MLEPFFVRALVASLGLAAVAAPLGCFVVWQRMAYFGETVAQAGLIGVALGLALQMDVTWGVLIVAARRRRPAPLVRAPEARRRSIPSSACCTTPRSRPASSPPR